MVDQENQQVRATLDARLEQVRAALRVLAEADRAQANGSRPQYGKRVGDHISDALETRRNVAARQTLQREEKEIVHALEELSAGTYGRCDRCGGPIGDERLAALPWASLCIYCKREAERPRR